MYCQNVSGNVYLEKSTEKQHREVGHEGHQDCRDAGKEKDKGHKDELLVTTGEVFGENITSEEATNEEAREAKSPNQIDCLCVCPEVVGQVWLHRTSDGLYGSIAKLGQPGQDNIGC